MSEDGLEARVAALERALTDGREGSVDDLPSGGDVERSVDDLQQRVEELQRRIEELDAALQAVRGCVGEVCHVNREVERRADAALAAVERIEEQEPGAGGTAGLAPGSAVADEESTWNGASDTAWADPEAADGDGVGAWPPDEDEEDPDDVLSRVRDAL